MRRGAARGGGGGGAIIRLLRSRLLARMIRGVRRGRRDGSMSGVRVLVLVRVSVNGLATLLCLGSRVRRWEGGRMRLVRRPLPAVRITAAVIILGRPYRRIGLRRSACLRNWLRLSIRIRRRCVPCRSRWVVRCAGLRILWLRALRRRRVMGRSAWRKRLAIGTVESRRRSAWWDASTIDGVSRNEGLRLGRDRSEDAFLGEARAV